MMNRRTFLGTSLAGLSTLVWNPVSWAQGSPNLGSPTLPDPGFKRMQLGKLQVVALNDGIGRRPLVDGFVRNAPLDQVKALLASQNLPTDYVDVPYTPFVILDGDKRYLLDTGFADNGPPNSGKLHANMKAAGIAPESITDVIISHYHGDHINGLRYKNGDWVYPNARVHVSAPEHAFWTDPDRIAKAPEAMKGAFAAVQRTLGSIPADKLMKFEPGAVVTPGITSMAAFGHTPGQCAFMVESDGQRFAYIADITNIPALFARNPDFAVMFDMNPDQARETRRTVLAMLARDKILTGGFHFPFPAMGTLVPEGQGYQFVPAN